MAEPHQDAVASVQTAYDGKLTPDLQAHTFRNIDRLFPTRTVNRAGPVRPLPQSERPLADVVFESNGRTWDLFDHLALNRVAGLLVLKDGAIAREDYELGNSPGARWASMSIAKSISSTLIGAAIQDGFIESLDDPVARYLPELGGAYAGVAIRDVLQMASGVAWSETYTDPASDRRRMLALQEVGAPGAILRMMAGLKRAGPPSTIWNYSTGETHVVGALVRAATARPVAAYLSEAIWSKLGMERDATWWLEAPNGLEVGGSGFSATLRDYARFGLFILEDGVIDGRRVLPPGWVEAAGSAKTIGGERVDYGYMWWPAPPEAGPLHAGAFMARGIFGQFLYVNRRERVVIAQWGARPKPKSEPPIADLDVFGAVVAALRRSEGP